MYNKNAMSLATEELFLGGLIVSSPKQILVTQLTPQGLSPRIARSLPVAESQDLQWTRWPPRMPRRFQLGTSELKQPGSRPRKC
ncbi:hypothetical protein HZ326_31377 [Fusarium oxysporum f. sp. albedinis]|nr:hypothetical protein HZ326_31377 [Fusarium oxysporum f. sp. albedinis]